MKEFWQLLIQPFCKEIRARKFLEVGSEDGFTTTQIAEYVNSIEEGYLVSIDPAFRFDVSEHTTDKVQFIKDLSLNVLSTLEPFEVGLIDGDHNWYTVFHELKAIQDLHEMKGRPFPVLFIHDTSWPYGKRDLYYKPENIPDLYRQPYLKAGIKLDSSLLEEGEGFNRNSCNSVYANTPQNGVLTAVEDFLSRSPNQYVCHSIPIFFGLTVLASKEFVESNVNAFKMFELLSDAGDVSKVLEFLEQNRLEGLIEHLELEKEINAATRDRDSYQSKYSDNLEKSNATIDALQADLDRVTSSVRYREVKQRQLNDRLSTLSKNTEDLRKERERVQEEVVVASRRLYDKKAALITHQLNEVTALGSMLQAVLINLKNCLHEGDVQRALRLQGAYHKIRAGGDSLAAICAEVNATVDRLGGDLAVFRQDTLLFSDETGAQMIFNQNYPELAYTYQHDRLGELYSRKATLEVWFEELRTVFHKLTTIRAYRLSKRLRSLKNILFKGNVSQGGAENVANLYERYDGWKEVTSSAFQAEFQQGSFLPSYNKAVDPIIVQFTPARPENPYYWMIGEALVREGVDYRFSVSFDEVCTILEENPHRGVIVHFHQLEPYYHDSSSSELSTGRNAQHLIESMRKLKRLGATLVWTKHNPLPHDRKYADMDLFLIRSMMNIMDHIVVLGLHAKVALEKSFSLPSDKISVIHHPSFKEIMESPMDRQSAREELGISGENVFGVVGNIKPYKGIEFIIDGFNKLHKEGDSRDILLIAGNASDTQYVNQLRQLVYDKEKIIFFNKKLSDQEVSTFVSALDFSVFAFKDIWGSSSVVLSLSLDTPVILPDIGCLSDYVRDADHGYFYTHDEIDSFVSKVREACATPYYEHMQFMCRKFSEEKSCTIIAGQFRDMYRQILSSESGCEVAA